MASPFNNDNAPPREIKESDLADAVHETIEKAVHLELPPNQQGMPDYYLDKNMILKNAIDMIQKQMDVNLASSSRSRDELHFGFNSQGGGRRRHRKTRSHRVTHRRRK